MAEGQWYRLLSCRAGHPTVGGLLSRAAGFSQTQRARAVGWEPEGLWQVRKELHEASGKAGSGGAWSWLRVRGWRPELKGQDQVASLTSSTFARASQKPSEFLGMRPCLVTQPLLKVQVQAGLCTCPYLDSCPCSATAAAALTFHRQQEELTLSTSFVAGAIPAA